MVAFLVVAVFLPEQVAQAVEYDWRVLWNKPAVGTLNPSYLKDIAKIDTALAIRNILKDIANKPINSIKVSSNLTINLDKPLKMSNQRIDEIFEWLKGKPCGSKALYDYLSYSGRQVAEGDIAIMALTVDILNGVVKPEGNPKVIKNSLYALSQAAKFFGADLYPVKIKAGVELNILVPFIAHLNGDHYVLVTHVTKDKVYYSDEHREEFLPKDKFFNEFSGYALTNILPAELQVLVPAESKLILGAAHYSSNWTPNASAAEMQNYSDSIMTHLQNDISSMRSTAQAQFIKDVGISIGMSLVSGGLQSSGWLSTTGTVLGMGASVRYAITMAATSYLANGLSTGEWTNSQALMAAGIGAGVGFVMPTVSHWLGSATDSIFGRTPSTTTPGINATSPGISSQFGNIAQGLVNGSVVSLTSSLFSMAGLGSDQTVLLSSLTSGFLLGAMGGLSNMTQGLSWFEGGISGGLTSLTSTYVGNLAKDELGIESSSVSMFIGNLAGTFTNTLVNGAFYQYNGQYLANNAGKIKIYNNDRIFYDDIFDENY